MAAIISSFSQFIRNFSTKYITYFKSSNIFGKVLLALVPLILACCICFVPITLLAPDTTPIPPPTLAQISESEVLEDLSVTEVAEKPVEIEAAEKPTELLPSATYTEQPATPTTTPTDTPEPTKTSRPTYTPKPLTPEGEEAVVTSVIDGDTIEVEIYGSLYPVRYIGIDTPERGQLFAGDATQANAALVAGQTVILVKDVSETDRYDRLLRYVYLLDGTFVNAELVRSGHARVTSYPPDVSKIDYFSGIEQEARSAGLGLWALSTNAQAQPPSNTPAPLPTNTQAPLASNTPAPPPTITVEQIPTDTPAPIQTNTPIPVLTDTPIPPPTEPPVQPPNVQITFIYFDGQVVRVESDEYAEITNQGGSAVNLAGWRLNAGDPGQDFYFPAFDLQPGQSCRVYTNEYHPETCGFSFGSGQAIWNNSDRDCGHLYNESGAEVSTHCY